MSAVWFTRDTVSDATPDGTVAMLRFAPNRGQWDRVEFLLRDVPLISNRPLTIDDLAPLIRSEFALFFFADGTRAVAMRATGSDLPREMLDAAGIVVQEVKPGLFLLSDRLRAVSSTKWQHRFVFPFSLYGEPLGTARLVQGTSQQNGTIYAYQDSGLRFRFPPLTEPTSRVVQANERTIVALSTPVLPNTSIQSLTQTIDASLSGMNSPSAGWVFTQLTDHTGSLHIETANDGTKFLLSFAENTVSDKEGHELLRSIVALEAPKTQTWTLPDGGTAEEYVIDPSRVTIEETTINGVPVAKAQGQAHTYYFAFTTGGTAFTNDETLVSQWVSEERPRSKNPCLTGQMVVNLQNLTNHYKQANTSSTLDVVELISPKLSTFRLNTTAHATDILLCH